ncbi:MAG: hypothetical protein ACT4O1_03030 [Gemmatimonadota bacterium]
MHTEHLQRVRPVIVVVAWLVAVAVASLVAFAIAAFNLVDPESAAGLRAQMAAVAVGFFAGGLFAGLRAGEAPILHGVAIALFSLIPWLVLNLLFSFVVLHIGWQSLTIQLTLTVLLIQMITAILGARTGYRRVVSARG